ncbi:MAG: hypothetical protein E7172_00755 [Firmicutes bacterium]|nr:hypothetical protein [Bacillota bacterium]
MMKHYYEDKYKKELTTKIKEIINEENKFYVFLEESIFYPQGGGQKGDRGYLIVNNEKYNVINTIKNENNESVLVLENPLDEKYLNNEVDCYLNWDFRFKQMRLHTALHLHHIAIEQVLNKKIDHPLKSAIEEDYAYNKYDENTFDANIIEKVNSRFQQLIESDAQVITYPDKEKENFRWWECLNNKIPCGGIHVDSLKELGKLKIDLHHKKKMITIKIFLND